MATYADLTLLAGRHRPRPSTPNRTPPNAGRYLVCALLADGNGGYDAALRDCGGCETQLWVSTTGVQLVDSRDLTPLCWACYLALRSPLQLHDEALPVLYKQGRSADASRIVDHLNDLADYLGR